MKGLQAVVSILLREKGGLDRNGIHAGNNVAIFAVQYCSALLIKTRIMLRFA